MIEKIRIGYSPLSQTLYLYRHGKDPALALEKREANADVMAAIIAYMMDDAPKGAMQNVTTDGKHWYEVSVTPIKNPAKPVRATKGKRL